MLVMTNYAKNYASTIYHAEPTRNKVLFFPLLIYTLYFLHQVKTDNASKGYCILHQLVDIENIIN